MDANNEELLKQILKATEEGTKSQKRATRMLIGVLLVFVIVAAILVPQVIATLNHVNSLLMQAEDAVSTIKDTSTQVSQMVSDNAVPLTESVQKLTTLDIEGLNKAITDLQDAIGPMANAMRVFR